MATIGMLTATNKKSVHVAAWTRGTLAATLAGGGRYMKAFPGNYCWMHGHCISKDPTSATWAHKATGHRDNATTANTFGGSEKDKGWDVMHT
jgi:hypothetical protein